MKKTALKFGMMTLPLLMAGLMGCSTITNSDDGADTSVTKAEVIETYANIVLASYEDSLSTASDLKTAIDTFIATPTSANFEAAKEAWLASRVPYGQTEGYRFYDGPIDDADGPEGQLNAWPLDEVYIDYVDGDSDSGIINDATTYPSITAEVLTGLNEVGGDKNISTGFHAIEFLLWGQDLTEGPGAGQRPFTDYLTDGNGTADNQARRATYLQTVAQILVDDLQSMVDAWDDEATGNYREEFLAMEADTALGKILRGIGTLAASELSAERMATPLDVKEREEEHSCFSDNTHVDIVENARSVQNVYLGSYTRTDSSVVSGASLYDLLSGVSATLANTLKTELETAMTAVEAIETPFDQEILGGNSEGNQRVQTAIDALQDVGESIVEGGTELGISVNTSL